MSGGEGGGCSGLAWTPFSRSHVSTPQDVSFTLGPAPPEGSSSRTVLWDGGHAFNYNAAVGYAAFGASLSHQKEPLL